MNDEMVCSWHPAIALDHSGIDRTGQAPMQGDEHMSPSNITPLNFTRRRAIQGLGVAAIAVTQGAITVNAAFAQSPSPVAAVDTGKLLELSQSLVGGGKLDEGMVEMLGQIIATDSAATGAVDELLAMNPLSAESLAAGSPEAQLLATNILQFWYLGNWNNEPIENRASVFFQLPVWQTLPYSTQPTLCKAHGYWATEVM
jgi:hypothetical protein